MARNKKADILSSNDAAELAAQLNEVTKNWRATHVISGNALEFVKVKAQAINEALNPATDESDVEAEETK